MDLVLLLINTDYPELFEKCFNPYFNGSSTSTFIFRLIKISLSQCFNPYFNGSSTSTLEKLSLTWDKVEGFNPYFNGSSTSTTPACLYSP